MEAEEGAIEGGGDEELNAVVDAMDEKDLFDETGQSICYLAMTLSHFCNESDMFLLSFWKLGGGGSRMLKTCLLTGPPIGTECVKFLAADFIAVSLLLFCSFVITSTPIISQADLARD